MKKFQEMLYNMAMNEDEVFSPEDAREASDLYEASKNMSDDELAIFVADHDDKLRSVLGISPYFPEDFRAEYNNLYTQGKEAFYDDGVKLRGAGKSKSLDDFMKAFRLFGENSGYSKRDISSFTNPESPYYWGRRSEDDKLNAAASLGYTNIEDMERDLNQLAVDQQHTAAIEGYNPDGTINVGGWLISAGEGLVLPRVKEAQLARREVTAKDVVGDLTELGLNFVPGVGFFNKSGKLVARMAGAGIESLAVPLGTNIYDVVFYGGDEFNPRGDTDPIRFMQRVGAQASGVAAGKGLLMAGGSMAKNFAETRSGGAAGDAAKRSTKMFVDDLGTKTDALIAKRQAMLDRKAELAKNAQYLNGSSMSKQSIKNDYVIDNTKIPDDIINAQDYEIRSNFARAMEAERRANKNVAPSDFEVSRPVAQLEDGRFVYADQSLLDGTQKWTPEGSGVEYPKPKYQVISYKTGGRDGVPLSENLPVKPVYASVTNGSSPELAKLAQNTGFLSTNAKEVLRDAGAHAAGNIAVREGILGQVADMDEKREIALWNKGVRKYRNLVNQKNVSPELKKRYLNAFINLKTYGLDSLPSEIYNLDPEVYDNAVKMMGIEGWPHKVPDQPTTSNSTKVF